MEWLKQLLLNKWIGSIIRTLMAALSGWLLSIGLSEGLVEAFTANAIEVLIGVTTYLIVQYWSLKEKTKK